MSKEPTAPDETSPEIDQENLEEVEESLDEIEQLTFRLAEKEEEVNELLDKARRSQAEMENFRKRIRREKTDSIQYANENFIREIIPISDDLDRALSASNISVESLKEGVEMISRAFHNFLKSVNVKPIPAKGEIFDPSIHEALSRIESEEHEENTVLEEHAKGYYLNNRVLIPAKVTISKKPDDSGPIGESPDDESETAS